MITTAAVENVFEAILRDGHDEDYIPSSKGCFMPTSAPPGSPEKVEVLRLRAERGQPLWHRNDRIDFAGVRAGVHPASSDPFQSLELRQPMLSLGNEEMEQQLQPSEDADPVEERSVFRRDYSPRRGSYASVGDGPLSPVTGSTPQFPSSGEPDQVSAAATSISHTSQQVDSQGSGPSEKSCQGQTPEPSCAQPAAPEPSTPEPGTNVLRPPTEKELGLIRAFKQSVGSGVMVSDFQQYMRELASQGVDLSAA